MKFPRVSVLLMLAATAAFARTGGGGGGSHGGGGGFHSGGGGGFRGGSSGFRGGSSGFRGGGVGGFNRGFVGGYGRGYGYGRFGYGFGLGLGLGYWGYGYPYYSGYPGYYGYAYPYDYSYPYGYYADPYYDQAPAVANQGYYNPAPPQPTVRDYSSNNSPQQSQEQLYLIAFQDHRIVAVKAYWAEGDILHYVTREGEHRQAPLSSIDRTFSEQLNRDRHVAFQLPR